MIHLNQYHLRRPGALPFRSPDNYVPIRSHGPVHRMAGSSLSGSQMGIAAATISAIVQGCVSVTLATVQLIYNEIQERRARKQWRHDQARQAEMREEEFNEIMNRNAELEYQLSLIRGDESAEPVSAPITTAVTAVQTYWPYAAATGLGILLLITLTRKK